MKLHPFYEVAANAQSHTESGETVWQQFNCARCKSKQTMEVANVFFKSGRCEECGHVTNIEQDGCNFIMYSNNLFKRKIK